MALHWRPVGPEPEKTYWQRRAVVALAVLLLLLLLLQLLDDDEADRLAQTPVTSATPSGVPSDLPPSAGPSATAEPSASTVPSALTSPLAAAPCAPGALDVTAAATEESYAVGSEPELELRVTMSGATPCTVDLGQAAVELVVFSGSDRIWSSDDCAPGGGAEVTTLQPGEVDVSRVTWPRTRSRPGCQGAKEQAQPGTYRVTARIGDQRIEGAAFLLRG